MWKNYSKDISAALTPKMEFIKAGGSYAVVFGKKLQTFAAKVLGIDVPQVYAASKEISHEGQGLTAVEEFLIKMLLELHLVKRCMLVPMLG